MAVIRISGYPGSGKTTLAKRLAEEYSYEYFYAGGLFRDMAREKNLSIEEFYRKLAQDPNLEKSVDERQAKLMQEKDNIVVEGRIAPFQDTAFKRINILLKVSRDEGARRQSLRPENTGKSISDIKKFTEERIATEREHYRSLYSIKDHFDEKQFDIVLDTTSISADKVFEIILDRIETR